MIGWMLAGATGASMGADAPMGIIFDTDMGNDIDDGLALNMLHALHNRQECRLLAVTVSKGNQHAAEFCDAVNTYYGHGTIPVGVVNPGPTPEDGKFVGQLVAEQKEGRPRYPRTHRSYPSAVEVLRRTLAAADDHSVKLAVVGFSTNAAALLRSPADAVSKLTGKELIERKVATVVMMAGNFSEKKREKEYNIYIDAPAAREFLAGCPVPVVLSGYEIGSAVKFPATAIESKMPADHPVRAAYLLYQKMPYDRETWDLTAVLHAVRPEAGYFRLSPPGTVTVDDRQLTQFAPSSEGRHRYLLLAPADRGKLLDALVELSCQPPRQP